MTELKLLSEEELQVHQRAVLRSRQRDKTDWEIVEILLEVLASRFFEKLGRKSLFFYANIDLDMTRSVGYSFSSVTEKCLQHPPLLEALKMGAITVSIAARLAGALTEDNAAELVEYACTHSKNQTEAEVHRIQATTGKEQRIMVWMTKSQFLVVKRANSVRSQKGFREDIAETACAVSEDYLERQDPVKKAERAEQRKQKKAQAQAQNKQDATSGKKVCPGRNLEKVETENDFGWAPWQIRVPSAAEQEHAVYLRSRGQCEYHDSNKVRCESDRFVDKHHIVLVSKGGSNHPSNLALLLSP